MRNVLIIGAGATRAEAISQQGNRRQRPPLDTDFFELAEIHDIRSHRDVVARFLKNNFSIEPFGHPRPRMEDVFGLVYTATLGMRPPDGAVQAFSSLCRIYATVIAETTNSDAPTKGPTLQASTLVCRRWPNNRGHVQPRHSRREGSRSAHSKLG